jgi:hypothetical protein
LPEAFTLTASLSFCSVGPCTGTIDVSFTDSFATSTTPVTSTIQVTGPNNTLPIRVKAADNPDGSINPGPASVYASVTAIQASPYARKQGPDPVGNNQYIMAVNIGDLQLSAASSCIGVRPQDPTAIQLGLSWIPVSGFNVASLAWEWEGPDHITVSGAPLSFNVATGTSTYSNGSYSALPTFSITNVSQTGVDGLQTYYLAVTITNGLATATEYFPFQFDLSQSQTFCPNLNGNFVHNPGAKAIGGRIIRGSWSKSATLGSSGGRPSAKVATGKLPDLRISPADISFTPSMPKNGDSVSVRFRISNVGDADAKDVPVALQVNGAVVATDTFDVGAGKTVLGALQWNNAKAPAPTATPGALARPGRGVRDAVPSSQVLGNLQAAVVIDPRGTIKQKTALAKSAPLAHFSLRDGTATTLTATLNQQRVVLELGEGGCAGLRFSLGAGGCTNADVTVNVEDLAKGTYKLEANNGIADLGIGVASTTSRANFAPHALGQNGHTYAVQLSGGRIGYLTVTAVRSPDQLSEAAKRIFKKPGARIIRKLGDTTGAPEPETSKDARVYFDISYQGQ